MTRSGVLLSFSFRGDYDLCVLMCETVDRFVSEELPHILYVPRSDIGLFKPLETARRRLAVQEDLLPAWMFKLPMPPPEWRGRFGLPRRNVYVSLKSGAVRGWIVQQMMKIAAASRTTKDLVVHVDSDVTFIRPLDLSTLYEGDRVRFKKVPGAANDAAHHRWHRASSALLAIPMADYHGADYIDTVVTWRSEIARQLVSHIEAGSRRDWVSALTGMRDLSEYTLYGVFCDHVLGMDRAGLAPTAVSLCETLWSQDLTETEANFLLDRDIRPDYVAIGVQSTINLDMQARRRILDHAIAIATKQDAERVTC